MRTHLPIGALAALLALAASAAGCGSPTPADAPAGRVTVAIAAPADGATIGDPTVEVRGRVRPATASVHVLGRPALVTGGAFTVVVPLERGANVIDVIASARGRAPALTAIRVTREELVTVPDLVDRRLRELDASLAPLGLELEAVEGGGVLDALVPRSRRVCEQQPPAGSEVRRGSTVRVVVARSC